MTDLDRLIEAVEAGTFTQTDFSWGGWHPNVSYDDARGAFTGSLDAAKRLHDALLPGWTWALQNDAANVIFSHAEVARVWDVPIYSAECQGNPARAWLLAILRAVKAKG